MPEIFGEPFQRLGIILHKSKRNIAGIANPSTKSSGLVAMVENNLSVRFVANFAALWLGSDLAQFNTITEPVFDLLIAAHVFSAIVTVIFRRVC